MGESCLRNCIEGDYRYTKLQWHTTGCEYHEMSNECYAYNNPEWEVTRGSLDEHDANIKCWVKYNFCSTDNDCDDSDMCDTKSGKCKFKKVKSDSCYSRGGKYSVLAI